MAAEVVINAEASACALIVVLHPKCRDGTGDPLVSLEHRAGDCAWLGCVEVGDVSVGKHIPVVVDVIIELQVAAILLETHVGTMVVASSIL